MKLDGKITLLVGSDYTTITIQDALSSLVICEVTLTPEQLSSALSRLANTDCSIEVFPANAQKWGKKMEVSTLEFELPEHLINSKRDSPLLKEHAQSVAPDGWKIDGYFGSQGSFFKKDGTEYARCNMRRWVEE